MKPTALLRILICLITPFAGLHAAPASAQYAGWQQSGSVFTLTPPETAIASRRGGI